MSWLSNLAHKLPSPVDPLHIFGKHNPTDPLNVFGKIGLPNPADPFNTFGGPGQPGAPATPPTPGSLAGGQVTPAAATPDTAGGQVVPPVAAPVADVTAPAAPTTPNALAGGAPVAPTALGPPTAVEGGGVPTAPAAPMSPQIQSFLNRIMHGGLSGFGAFGGMPFGGFGQFLMSNPDLMRELGITPQGAGPLPGAAPVDSGPAGPMLRTG